MSMPGGWELVLIAGVLVLLFGSSKLPEMARSLGQSARVLKAEVRGIKEDARPSAGSEHGSTSPADQSSAGQSSAGQSSAGQSSAG